MKIKTNLVLFVIMFMSFAFAMSKPNSVASDFESRTSSEDSRIGSTQAKVGNSQGDVNITAQIRQDIMKQKELRLRVLCDQKLRKTV